MAQLLNDSLIDYHVGKFIAHTSLIIMSSLSIVIGSFLSISRLQKQKDSGQKADVVSKRDAALFAIKGTFLMLGLYIFLQFLSQLLNLATSLHMLGFGTILMLNISRSILAKFIPYTYQVHHHLVYTKGTEEIISFSFGTPDIAAFVITSVISCIYLWNKSWMINNLFCMVIAVYNIETLHLNTVEISYTFLGVFCICDIIWVFSSDVMVTVTKSFIAPALVFPVDFLENWMNETQFVMLGLADIIIPGIFIAFLLRFDDSLKRGQKLYFFSSIISYFIGLVLALVVMSIYEHAQPVLLYIVTTYIGIPCVVAIFKGDVNALVNYKDYPDQ